LIAQAVIKLFKSGVKSALALVLCVFAFLLTALPKVTAFPFEVQLYAVILCAAAIGAIAGFVKARRRV
jgi:ribose/xylose/arabinose/galactoside ABC-type transport system permease subunit